MCWMRALLLLWLRVDIGLIMYDSFKKVEDKTWAKLVSFLHVVKIFM